MERLLDRALRPVDSASLAVFRFFFGVICFWEVTRYFRNGWISRYWEEPAFHFHYVGWGWVEPLPAPGMQILWGVLGIAAVGIALGALYRVCAIVFALGFGYSFLLDAAQYLNHFYFIELLAILMAVVPAHRRWSVDAKMRGWDATRPIPSWALWLIRFQIAVLYVGGGIAKLEPDWLRGEPLGTWLARHTDFFLVGGLFDHPWAGVIAAWAGMFLDLGIVFAIWWRPTRLLALNVAVLFHFLNSQMYTIGVFPFLALAGLTIWCPPDWPQQLLADLQGRRREPDAEVGKAEPSGVRPRFARVWIGLAAVYVAAQVLIPLRHVVMPGRASWNEAGHTFSWRMKLRDKEGDAMFRIVNPTTGAATVVSPLEEIDAWQYSDLTSRPELLRQYADHLADINTRDGVRPRVYALTQVSLNGRPPQPMIDPQVDLAAQDAVLGTPTWVTPMPKGPPRRPSQGTS